MNTNVFKLFIFINLKYFHSTNMYLYVVLLALSVCVASSDGQIKKPNIVLFLTDDQDILLNGMTPMQNVNHLIANEGITFNNAYTASPICCPSRASILTGMYPHNHKTKNNSISGGCNGRTWKILEQRTFATILQSNGYNTFYAGKYLNRYGVKEAGGPEVVPPGWTEWHGLVGNSVYYDYVISNNGVPTHSDNLYLTDVIRDLSVSYIEKQSDDQPFLLVAAPPAPHAPFTPAPRHKGLYANVTALNTPNFNVKAEMKHWLLNMPPSPLPASILPELHHVYRSRWESLLAVDEMVAAVVRTLSKQGLLDNTYILYTSDNGYHIGQFSQVYDKRQPYETDIKVPLMIRGPKIGKNVTSNEPVMNIDLAPTILSLAGLEAPEFMDGRAMSLTLTQTEEVKERYMLIEYYGEGSARTVDATCPWKYDGNVSECSPLYECKCQDSRNNTYACIRHLDTRINFKYCFFRDRQHFEEMYDLSSDPYEMYNIIDEVMPALKYWYQLHVVKMLRCVGHKECDDCLYEKSEVQIIEF